VAADRDAARADWVAVVADRGAVDLPRPPRAIAEGGAANPVVDRATSTAAARGAGPSPPAAAARGVKLAPTVVPLI